LGAKGDETEPYFFSAPAVSLQEISGLRRVALAQALGDSKPDDAYIHSILRYRERKASGSLTSSDNKMVDEKFWRLPGSEVRRGRTMGCADLTL